MPDDKIDEPADQDYEVSHIAAKYGISSAEVRKLIDLFGNDREKLYAAETLRLGWLT